MVTNFGIQQSEKDLIEIRKNALLGYIWKVFTKLYKWIPSMQASGQEINKKMIKYCYPKYGVGL